MTNNAIADISFEEITEKEVLGSINLADAVVLLDAGYRLGKLLYAKLTG